MTSMHAPLSSSLIANADQAPIRIHPYKTAWAFAHVILLLRVADPSVLPCAAAPSVISALPGGRHWALPGTGQQGAHLQL